MMGRKSVKKLFLSAGFIFLLVHFVSCPAVLAADSAAVLSEIQSRYEKTNDLEAGFVQESVGKVMMSPQKGEGKVYFKKKGMMRWDYRVPSQKLISNGRTLWYYQPDENQVLVYDVSKFLKEKVPLAFLAGEGDLGRDFNLLHLTEPSSQKGESYVLEMAPKEPYGALAKLVLTVDKKTYLVVQADVFDELGNVTRTRFTDIKTNTGLPSSFFQFTIPPGAEVMQFKDPPGSAPTGKGSPRK
jgi:outer membrane lipoprotein carrier protein